MVAADGVALWFGTVRRAATDVGQCTARGGKLRPAENIDAARVEDVVAGYLVGSGE